MRLFSVYIPTRQLDQFAKMIIFFRFGAPHFKNRNWTQVCMAYYKLTPKFKYTMLLYCQTWDIFSIYIPTRELDQFVKMVILFRVETPYPFFFKNRTQWCMTDFNLTPNFKYSMLICCWIGNIFSICIPTRELYQFMKMNILVSFGTPHRSFFHKLNTLVHERLKPYATVQNSTLLCCKTETFLVYIEQIDLDQFMEMINMFRFGTPQPFPVKRWTQWCMAGLNLTLTLKYSTIQSCQNIDIFIIYITTRSISVHINDQHVQVCNPTTIFSKIAKIKKRKSKNR